MLSAWEKALFSLVILATFGGFVYPVYLAAPDYPPGKAGVSDRTMCLATPGRHSGQGLPSEMHTQRRAGLHRPYARAHLLRRPDLRHHDRQPHAGRIFRRFFLFGNDGFGLFFHSLVDILAVLVLVGVAFFIVRRFIIRPKAYKTTLLDSGLIYLFIISVTLSYLYFEAFAVASHRESARLSFLGKYLAASIQGLGLTPQPYSRPSSASPGGFISCWSMVSSPMSPTPSISICSPAPVNVFFRSGRPSGEIQPLDIEKAEVFGVEKAIDLTWKDFLDAFACMECGRCQDACPAFASGKPLSPKMIIFNLEKHLLDERQKLLKSQRDDLTSLFPDVYSEGEIWTCTTCGACQHVCPVEIEHIRKIVGIRQSEVLMQSRFPQELNTFFRNMETNSNPWGIGFAKRADWAAALDVPLLAERDSANICSGSAAPGLSMRKA